MTFYLFVLFALLLQITSPNIVCRKWIVRLSNINSRRKIPNFQSNGVVAFFWEASSTLKRSTVHRWGSEKIIGLWTEALDAFYLRTIVLMGSDVDEKRKSKCHVERSQYLSSFSLLSVRSSLSLSLSPSPAALSSFSFQTFLVHWWKIYLIQESSWKFCCCLLYTSPSPRD